MVFKHPMFHNEAPEVEQEYPEHAILEGAVADALAAAGGIDASDVTVVAEGSVVKLGGTVLSEGEIARAAEVALSVGGVTDVRNEIRLA